MLKCSPFRKTALSKCRIRQPLDADSRTLEPPDHDRGVERLVALYAHLDGVAQPQALQLRTQFGPCPERCPVDADEAIAAVQPCPSPNTRGVVDHEPQRRVPLVSPDPQIALRLTVVDRGSPAQTGL